MRSRNGRIFGAPTARLAAALVLIGLVAPATRAGAIAASPLGTVKLTPATATAGAPTTLTISYAASGQVPFVGQLRVDVPAGFSVPQTSDATAASYLNVASTTCATAAVTSITPFGAGRRIVVTLDCARGKTAVLHWQQATVPSSAAAYTLAASAGIKGANFKALPEPLTLTAAPGIATHLLLSAPATAVEGQPFSFTVSARDAAGNVDPSYTGLVHFNVPGGGVTVPGDYQFTGADHGTHFFRNGATMNVLGVREVEGQTTGVVGNTQAHITALEPLHISPAESTVAAGSPQSYNVAAGGADVTNSFTFTIAPDGLCNLNACTPSSSGSHLVTATNGTDTVSALLLATEPCTKTWANPGTDGLWSDASSWSPSGVPGANDIACLPAGSYTVTVHDAEFTDEVTIGSGVTVLVHGDGTFTQPDLETHSIIDHGLVHLDLQAGATSGGGLGTQALGIASDGALEAGGTVQASMTADVYNAGAVTVDSNALLSFDCGACGSSTWVNLAGSNMTVDGTTQSQFGSVTFDHQLGATLDAGDAGLKIADDSFSNPTPTFRDDGGAITGAVGITDSNLVLHAGMTGEFDLNGAVLTSGTIGDGQRVEVTAPTFPSTDFTANALTNRGDLVLLSGDSGVIEAAGDITNAATGTIEVPAANRPVGLLGGITNSGAIHVAAGARFAMTCEPVTCATSTWTNLAGSHTTFDGLVELGNGVTFDHRAGAVLSVGARPDAELLLDYVGSHHPVEFIDNGGRIDGHIDVLTSQLQLNAGHTGEFDVYGLSNVRGTIGSGQTVEVVAGTDPHEQSNQASFGTDGLVNHGRLVLTSQGQPKGASFAGPVTNAADGIIRVVAGDGGARGAQSLVNNGRLRLDPHVELGLSGDYTQGASGLFDTTMNAFDSGVLAAEGNVHLAGALYVGLAGTTPHPGDRFTIIFGARNGTKFSSASAGGYKVVYSTADKVMLTK